MCIAAHGTDRLSYLYTFSFCFLHAMVHKSFRPDETSFHTFFKVCLLNSPSIFLENHFSVEVIPVFDHTKAYIYSIFSCEGQDFLH